MNAITCPSCGEQFEISQAIAHQIQEKITKDLEVKHAEELTKVKAEIAAKAEKKIKEELEFTLKNSENELKEAKERDRKKQEELLLLHQQIRKIQEESEKKELEAEKRFTSELGKMREDISKSVHEKSRLKELELEKRLQDTQKALEDARRKAEQVSQQLQGEVLELDFESQLRSTFTLDEFSPVPKGIEGADIWQKVHNKYGQTAGSILWELKRTKSWSNGWLPKLREDTRKVNASISVLVSSILPDEVKHFGRTGGVWVSSYEHGLRLAAILRDCLLQIAIAKSSASHKDEKLQEIYEYITSIAFRHKFEAHFESVKALQEELESEKRAMERIWKKREVQIQRLDRSASQMFGEIQGIIGESFPVIKTLELDAGVAVGDMEVVVNEEQTNV